MEQGACFDLLTLIHVLQLSNRGKVEGAMEQWSNGQGAVSKGREEM